MYETIIVGGGQHATTSRHPFELDYIYWSCGLAVIPGYLSYAGLDLSRVLSRQMAKGEGLTNPEGSKRTGHVARLCKGSGYASPNPSQRLRSDRGGTEGSGGTGANDSGETPTVAEIIERGRFLVTMLQQYLDKLEGTERE